MENIYQKALQTADYIKTKLNEMVPEIGIVLGSGLGVLVDELEKAISIPYSEIPNFPTSTVQGHAGKLVIGFLKEKCVLCMQGRFHYYEGYGMHEVSFPVRVMKLLGINDLMVTNAAGGINKSFQGGDLMIISDHIKFFSDGPLRGKNIDEMGERFPDVGNAYTKELRKMAQEVGKKAGIDLKEGVYAYMPGPAYETPAEIRALGIMGADAVGMSTVPEVMVAAHSGMKVLGISCITNMAAGILDKPLNHKEVIASAEAVKNKFLVLVKECVENWNIGAIH
jgi:purine-nucleoside phosphorylase